MNKLSRNDFLKTDVVKCFECTLKLMEAQKRIEELLKSKKECYDEDQSPYNSDKCHWHMTHLTETMNKTNLRIKEIECNLRYVLSDINSSIEEINGPRPNLDIYTNHMTEPFSFNDIPVPGRSNRDKKRVSRDEQQRRSRDTLDEAFNKTKN